MIVPGLVNEKFSRFLHRAFYWEKDIYGDSYWRQIANYKECIRQEDISYIYEVYGDRHPLYGGNGKKIKYLLAEFKFVYDISEIEIL